MIGRRLTQGMLVLGLMACTSGTSLPGTSPSDSRGPASPATSGPAATGATTGFGGGAGSGDASDGESAGGSTGGTPSNSGETGVDVATVDAPRAPFDGGRPVIHDDGPPIPIACTSNRATLGSNRLMAGGSTPAPFAAAYNAELAALHGAGPFLLVLSGVNDATPAGWIASIGALGVNLGGEGVGFEGRHADVAFAMDAARWVRIAPTEVSFELKFTAPASEARVPVGSIDVSGTLSTGCGSLVVTRARLLVPKTAGDITFHGSTIQGLMGPATESYQGEPAGAWPLELAGTAKQVYAPGVLDDGGTGP
jgi:hypothetical protein